MAKDDPAQHFFPKIAQLVADAKAHLESLGIDTTGKLPAEILTMAREERNKPPSGPKKRTPKPPKAE